MRMSEVFGARGGGWCGCASGMLTGWVGCGAEREFHRHGVPGDDECAQFLIDVEDEGRWRSEGGCGVSRVHPGPGCGVVCVEVGGKHTEVAACREWDSGRERVSCWVWPLGGTPMHAGMRAADLVQQFRAVL